MIHSGVLGWEFCLSTVLSNGEDVLGASQKQQLLLQILQLASAPVCVTGVARWTSSRTLRQRGAATRPRA